MDKLSLQAKKRTLTGRKVKNLRKEGILPANVFGKKVKSEAVSVKLSDFLELYKKAGETTLVNLIIEGDKGKKEEKAVLVSNIQYDPISDSPLHVDFHQVDLKEKVTAEVPIEVMGESPTEKQGVGTVVTYINEIEVEALPRDLPEKFIVDVSNLTEVDQAILVKDLKYDRSKVEVKIDPKSIVTKVEPPQKEEVIVPPPEVTEAVGPEGAVPAEGEAEVKEGEEKKPEEEKEMAEEETKV